MLEVPSGARVVEEAMPSATVLLAGLHPVVGAKGTDTRAIDERVCVGVGGMGLVKRGGNHVVLSTV